MKLMVIGGGGREHAIIKKLKENPQVEVIYALPGNGGMADDAACVNIGAKDIPAQVEFAKANGIDFAVVAPDDPLVLGAVDALNEIGIPCFGPNKAAAIIEGSKVFSKNLMKKYGIPTAAYETFEDFDAAVAYLQTADMSSNTSYSAVGMPYFFIRFLEKTLLPSMMAAQALGPKQGIPFSSKASTQPRTRGSSGATTA